MEHFVEWQASGVDQSLINLNVITLEGNAALDHLLYADSLPRRNDGRLGTGLLQRYQHAEAGGWWCSGIDLLTGQEDLWGCFKPDSPRKMGSKIIKYEHPPSTATGVFALRVPLSLWQSIGEKYQTPIEPQAIDPNQPDLGFWQWVIDHPELPICITEGAKKAGALLSAGYIAIALPGIHNGYRVIKDSNGERVGKSHLIPQLLKLAAPSRPVYICFDQDIKPTTLKAVQGAIKTMGYLLAKSGCLVKVITWNPNLGKGVDDLIAQQGQAVFEQLYQSAPLLDIWKAQSLRQLTYTPQIHYHSRYLPVPDFFPQQPLVALKSAKGTGKTAYLAHLVAQAQAQGRKVLVIGHRIRLLEALCQRFKLPYITEAIQNSERDSYGLCIDSLHPSSQASFDPTDWQGALIIIDEIEQVLWHCLNSNTCKNQRVAILKTFKTLLQEVIQTQGQICVADADLSDIALDYLIALTGIPIQPLVIENTWQPPREKAWTIYSYQDNSPKRLVRDLEKHLKAGGKALVCLSAQKLTSPWGTQTLEAYFQTQFPQLRILRLDSESLAQPDHPAYGCISRLDQVLPQYDLVLASPSLETGISIDLKNHFTSVWAIAQGIQTAESVCQSLARVRENIPRYIWVAPYGFNQVGDGSTSIPTLLTGGHRLTQVNIRLLQQADFDSIDDVDTGFQAESLLCWAKMAVRVNSGMMNYRDTVQSLLFQSGHHFTTVLPRPDHHKSQESNDLTRAIVAVQSANYQSACEAIAAAEDLTPLQYQILHRQLVKTPAQKQAVKKYELKLHYRVPVTPVLVAKDRQGWYLQLRSHYFLTRGRAFLADRDSLVTSKMIEHGQGALFLPDFNDSQLGALISLLEILHLPQLLGPRGQELKNTDPDLVKLKAIAIQNRAQIKAITKIALSPKYTPLQILSRFLTLTGHSLTCIRVIKQRPKNLRAYRIVHPQDDREAIFERWWTIDSIYPGYSEPLLEQINRTNSTVTFPEQLQLTLDL